jgi:hypothetical protein
MVVRVGDLEKRQLERLRMEIAETLAANFAYPPFFDFRTNRMLLRPIDRAKRSEVEHFVHTVNFSTIERVEVIAPEVRRFIERIFDRYIEVNTALAHPRLARFLPGLRAHAARMASQLQRNLLAHLERSSPAFGAPREQPSWAGTPRQGALEQDETEHNTRVLEATLLRRPGDAPGPYVPVTRRPGSPVSGSGQSPRRNPGTADATVAGSAQSTPVNPHSGSFHPGPAGRAGSRDLPPDLLQLYGEYLSDMQPEVYSRPPDSGGYLETSAGPRGHVGNLMQGMSQFPVPNAAQSGALSEDTRSDKLIFWQLRYQVEAYIRRAARSYGVQVQNSDAFGILDALRRSGFVDESDLQIAEGILALTDTVTAGRSASVEDYRKAFMLYLLYHRSHLAN